VLPDLPYVRNDVPGNSEAIGFALSMHARIRAFAAVLIVSILGLALLAQHAAADDLVDRRDWVRHQLARTQADLSESSNALSVAVQAVDRTEAKLAEAQMRLGRTQDELAIAQADDLRMAARLRQARADLAAAAARVVSGQQNLDAERAAAGNMIRDQYQQQSNLLPLAVLVDASSSADLQTRLQWSTTMFDSTQAEIDRLTRLQRQLTAERARQAALEAQVKIDRRTAASTLRIKTTLEARAAAEEGTVRELLGQRQSIERSAAENVAEDKAQYASLTEERAAVEKRIAIRIAEAKAAAARKAAAERAAKIAAQRRAAAERAREVARERARERAARHGASSARKTTNKSFSARPDATKNAAKSERGTERSATGYAGHGFSYPVYGPITSPFGMRYHPVLHYWKLHDGTDFGAGCGAPIHAPASGRVAERYYNAGYGNRLMIDHGRRDGKFVTTGYNHASQYTVHVGERVRRGEVIGYVGSTGFSTGCHLHLMVWLNGRVVNPMIWF
jgi:murein DD-endopeptidase MepM/ murein hydrolase activator NlpD